MIPRLFARLTLAAAILAAASASAQVAPSAIPTEIVAATASPGRTPENRARDVYRHPGPTLAFFGLKPGMTVVEIWPSGMYFTQILAPAIGAGGHLYAATSAPDAATKTPAAIAALQAKLATDPVYANTSVTALGKRQYDIAPPGSADMVLTFRNVHNWLNDDYAPQAFQAFYRALKPGGVLGVEEHRLPENRSTDLDGSKGYVKQSAVIAMAQAAGFKLVTASEINANPKDTADYPKGVWTLPPNYAEGDKDRARYAAIGESDRMTLKFVKP